MKVPLIYLYLFSLIFVFHFQELSVNVTRGLLDSIQNEIQHKDDQMAWVDSCCLQLSLRNKDDTYTFQMDSPEARKEWITGMLLIILVLNRAVGTCFIATLLAHIMTQVPIPV